MAPLWTLLSLLLVLSLSSIMCFRSLGRIQGFSRSVSRLYHITIKPHQFPYIWRSVMEKDSITDNNTDFLLNLVRLGDRWSVNQTQEVQSFLEYEKRRDYKKVTGCLANVYIKIDTDHKNFPRRVIVKGAADSRVAQGLLAFLAEGLKSMSARRVLSLSPSSLSRKLGFQQLLPMGRQGGFQNMFSAVQELLKQHQAIQKGLNGAGMVHEIELEEEYSEESEESSVKIEEKKPSPSSMFTSELLPEEQYKGRGEEVAVLLSGGVDSSVALKLLQDQGHKVRAYYLKIWLEDELAHLNECPWEEDLHYASETCKLLNVPLEVVPLQREYFDYVVHYTIQESKAGRTPNPDVMCNSLIKFGMFYEYVGKYSRSIATGHYAQVKHTYDETGRVSKATLLPSPDRVKDQSYFLSNLRQEQLRRCMFPIGHLEKAEVRRLAEQFGLPTKQRKDSQGICFLGKLSFDQFIHHYLGENIGDIKDYSTNEVIGSHRGLWFHTIGQRKGIGLLLHSGYVHNGPFYVADKDVKENVLYVTNNYNIVDEPRRKFIVRQINWLDEASASMLSGQPVHYNVKLRHGPTCVPATVHLEQVGEEARFRVELDAKDKGIAPGQFAVFYCPQSSHAVAAGSISLWRDGV